MLTQTEDHPPACQWDDLTLESAEDRLEMETPEAAERRIYRNAYRQAALAFGSAFNEYAFYILNHHDARLAMWVICYALELKPARGKTCEEIGKLCGLRTRQQIDREVQHFCDATGYTPATPMKSQRASAAYRDSRIASILESQES